MKVLFVEDENVKQSNIVTYLKDELGVENISVVNSLMGGMLALRNGKFDIVLLDMSLPLYDINGEDEELNEFEAFGGIEILDEIDRKELSVKVLVITAFDVIEDDTKK
ncbi:MAG: response regulator [Gallintestinimicrobium sp.]